MNRFRLYVAEATAQSKTLQTAVEKFLAVALGTDFTLQVVEVLENPELAEEDLILATPTLVRNEPPPTKKVFGNLRDAGQVLQRLGLAA